MNERPPDIRFSRKLYRLIGSFFAGLVVGFILVFLIGYLVDLATYPWLKKIGKSALQNLKENAVPPDSNAWELYDKAMDKTGDRHPSPDLIRYSVGDTSLTGGVEEEISNADDLYQLVEIANRRPGCSFPLNYHMGWYMDRVDYRRLEILCQYIAARSYALLDHGETDAALKSINTGLAFLQKFSHGTPELGNYAFCNALLQKQLRPLRAGLKNGRFTHGQLSSISAYLANLEVGFPTLRWVLEGEINIRKVSFANMPLFLPLELNLPRVKKLSIIKKAGLLIKLRFLLWRYGFSPRLGVIQALKFWDQIIKEQEKLESNYLNQTWPQDEGLQEVVNLRLFRYSRWNPIFVSTIPAWSGFFRTKTEMLVRIRLLNLASRLWSYRNEHGRFPFSLSEIEDYSAVEPFTGVAWNYIWSRDSVVITSPGFNQIYGDVNDLTLTLKKEK